MEEVGTLIGTDPEFLTGSDRAEPRLRVVGTGTVDLPRATRAVADLLDALGVDRGADGLAETPGRVAHAYAELL
ncbi:MAG: hypothetical protein ACRDV6_05935, partial [Acidimicrobiales bacterium]